MSKETQKTVPEIRFSGFEDAWELRKLINFTRLITKGTTPKDKTGSGKINFVKVENLSNGEILPIQKITEEEHEGYLKRSRLEEDDILFSIAGTLGRTAIVTKSILPANTNQALAIIRNYDFNKNFLITTLTGHVVAEYIRKNPTVGAQPNLSLEQVGQLTINTPSKGEQQKIGTFFKQIDNLITLHQEKLSLFKETKKVFLQQLFPAKDEKIPAVRFVYFDDEWKQRKLGELADEIGTGRSKFEINKQSEESPYPILGSTNIIGYESSFDHNGNFILTARVGVNAGNLYLHSGKVKITDNTVFIQSQKLYFVYFLLNKYDLKRLSFGTGQPLIKASELKKLNLLVPNGEEQTKIGDFFKQLDDLIALHQRKLAQLQTLKKAYLQKIFI